MGRPVRGFNLASQPVMTTSPTVSSLPRSKDPWSVAIDARDLDALRALLTPTANRPWDAIRAELCPRRHEEVWLYAVRYGTPDVLEVLAPHVNPRGRENGLPPVMVAVIANNAPNVSALLNRWGGDEDLPEVDGGGLDSVHIATQFGHALVLTVLLDHLANPYESVRAFHLAVRKERWATVDALAARHDVPEHRVLAKLASFPDDVAFPQWTARREARELNDEVKREAPSPTGMAPSPSRFRL